MKGKFVTVEGCEGVGKSTLIEGLKGFLERAGVDAVFTREPGGTPTAEKIRRIILDGANRELTPTAELLLYAAARAQHTREFILPALEAGKLVVCDRYSDSTLAYQGYARGLDIDLCRTLNSIAECGAKVDLTIFLDLDPEAGFMRKGGADRSDRLESAGLDFHRRVYAGYLEIAKSEQRVLSVPAASTPDEVLRLTVDGMKKRGIIE